MTALRREDNAETSHPEPKRRALCCGHRGNQVPGPRWTGGGQRASAHFPRSAATSSRAPTWLCSCVGFAVLMNKGAAALKKETPLSQLLTWSLRAIFRPLLKHATERNAGAMTSSQSGDSSMARRPSGHGGAVRVIEHSSWGTCARTYTDTHTHLSQPLPVATTPPAPPLLGSQRPPHTFPVAQGPASGSWRSHRLSPPSPRAHQRGLLTRLTDRVRGVPAMEGSCAISDPTTSLSIGHGYEPTGQMRKQRPKVTRPGHRGARMQTQTVQVQSPQLVPCA